MKLSVSPVFRKQSPGPSRSRSEMSASLRTANARNFDGSFPSKHPRYAQPSSGAEAHRYLPKGTHSMRIKAPSAGLALLLTALGSSGAIAQSNPSQSPIDGRWDASLVNNGPAVPFRRERGKVLPSHGSTSHPSRRLGAQNHVRQNHRNAWSSHDARIHPCAPRTRRRNACGSICRAVGAVLSGTGVTLAA